MKVALYLLAGIGLLLMLRSMQGNPLKSGQSAPLSTEVHSFDGQPWTLARFKGKPMVVNFWATWCPPCVQELPVLNRLSRQYADSVHFVGLSVDSPANDVVDMIRRFDISYPIARVEHGVVETWQAHSLPTTYVLDISGQIVWSHLGPVSLESLDDALHQVLKK